MPLLRRKPADTATLAKAVVAELEKANLLAGLGAMGTASAIPSTRFTTGSGGYYEAMPWTDPATPFSPGKPIPPGAIDPLNERGRTEPRTYEVQVGWNLLLSQSRMVPFAILRKAAEVDLVRRCIEIRKADIVALEWDITLTDRAVREAMDKSGVTKASERAGVAQAVRAQFEGQIMALKEFWTKPDRLNNMTFSQWLNALLEERLVTDAVSIYPHPTLGGPIVPGLSSDTHSLRILDGSTIKPLYNHLGNLPQPPQPAYQQVMYGFPRGEFTYDPGARGDLVADTLMYRPANKRVTSPYGYPPVEQALPFIDLWLKREEWLRDEYNVGSVPRLALRPIPGSDIEWNPEKRRLAERNLNNDLSGQTAERLKIKLFPPGLEPLELAEFAEKYQTEFDDFLALRIAAFFDVMSTQLNITPKGGLGGKGHQEGEAEKAEDQARQPTINYLVDVLNDCSQMFLGAPKELTFVFRSEDDDDIAEVTTSRQTELFSGQTTLNDIMAETGRPLFDFAEADMPFIVAPGVGITFLEGASVTPEPPTIVQMPGLPGASPSPGPTQRGPGPSTPPKAPGAAAKDAEKAAYARFVTKGDHRRREFVWKHHDPDEIKAVEAELVKVQAPARPAKPASGTITSVASASVNWDTWKPGSDVVAAKVKELVTAALPYESLNPGASMAHVAEVIANGVAGGDSVDTIARNLGTLISSADAAFMVADTEVASAMTQASLDFYSANGVTQWNWLAESDCCADCNDAEASNPHDLGDEAPPQHPRCRCAVSPVVDTGYRGDDE